jgi:CCR4-NOT transcriptional regulation complex NOT5 subunit
MDENQFKQVLETILDDLKTKLENSKGIDVFVKKRAKFEGWLKVEIVNILCNRIPDKTDKIIPEKYHVDIVFDDSALELKTVNTSYRRKGVENKIRPLTFNIDQLTADIKKLRYLQKGDIKNKAVLFVVFPLPENSIEEFEAKHLTKLSVEKQDIMYRQFNTISGITNRIYCVIVREQ